MLTSTSITSKPVFILSFVAVDFPYRSRDGMEPDAIDIEPEVSSVLAWSAILSI